MAALQSGFCVVLFIAITFLCPGEAVVLRRGFFFSVSYCASKKRRPHPYSQGMSSSLKLGNLIVERRLNLAQVLFRRLVLRTVRELHRSHCSCCASRQL